MNDKLLKSGEAAKFLNIPQRTFNDLVKRGIIIPEKIADNGYKFYSSQQLSNFSQTWQNLSSLKSKTKQIFANLAKSKRYLASDNQNLAESNQADLDVQNSTHRTKDRSGITEDVTYPENFATPTYKPYQYALQAGIDTSKLKLKEGKLFFEDENSKALRELTEVELKNCKTWEPITEVTGLPFLRAYYSILLGTYQEALRQGKPLHQNIKIYVPDLLEYLGLQRNAHKQTIDKIINQMLSFNNVIGVMNYIRNGKPRQSYYAIFLFGKYEEQSNTITVWSPYLIKVIETIIDEAIKIDSKTKLPKLDKNGKTIPLATNSFLIKSSIYGERNQAAVENVIIIIQVIEQAGNFTPNIKASTIIERNPIFKYRLDETNVNHKGRLLERVFKRTWELLREQTHLSDVYKNIQLPDPNDPKNIPTTKTLNMVFSFPHEGKQPS